MTRVQIAILAVVFVLMSPALIFAETWRGITPLRSTRTDVERLLGKPNKLGRYEIGNERAYIFYSEGQCTSDYESVAEKKCECLVSKDTVLRIAITLENAVKFRNVNKHRFSRKTLKSYGGLATYSDLGNGLVYTVRESDEMVTAIDYWPSAADCNLALKLQTIDLQHTAWRGIRPLHTTKKDVEHILGQSKSQSLNGTYLYDTPAANVDVLYSEGPCTPTVVGNWNVPVDTVLRIRIYPLRELLIRDLRIVKDKYRRGSDPNIPNSFFWISLQDGVTIHSQLKGGSEQIISIALSGSRHDASLLCK